MTATHTRRQSEAGPDFCRECGVAWPCEPADALGITADEARLLLS